MSKAVKVRFQKVHPKATIPRKASSGACAFDLTAVDFHFMDSYEEYDTGIVVAIPEGYVGVVVARNSISNIDWFLCNGVGIIDKDFRGSIKLRFKRTSNEGEEFNPAPYYPPDRIGQLLILPNPEVEFEEVESFDITARGTGGFGHTGK